MMKRFLIIAITAVFTVTLQAAPRYCYVTLVQWNLHIALDMTWRFNLKRQADVLNKLNGDVVVLNEVDKNHPRTGRVDMTKELATLTGTCFAQFAGARIDPPDSLYGNAILSRYRMEIIGSWLIPAAPDETRSMTLAKIGSSNPLLVAFTHLNFRNTPEENLIRVAAVKKIDELITANNPDDLPVVLVGDFNCGPGSDPVKALEYRGWKLEKPLPSYPSKKPVSSIDHIFVKDARVEVVERTPIDEKIASDHIPIVNKLRIYRNKDRK